MMSLETEINVHVIGCTEHIDLKSATIIQYTIKGRFMSR